LYQPRMIGDGDCGEIGGMKIGRGNRSMYSEKTCRSAALSTTWLDPCLNPGRRGGMPATIFFNLCGGTLGTAATTGLLYKPRMISEGGCGEIGGMKIGGGNQSTRRKPVPAPLRPPKIPHD
jgi:hypothetical protein